MTTHNHKTWYEVWQEELDHPRNQCVAVSGQATLRQAIARFNESEVKGELWWPLVVAGSGGIWKVQRFADLVRRLETEDESVLDTPLDGLDLLSLATVQDLDEITPRAASREASKLATPHGVVIVTQNGEFAGVVNAAQLGVDPPSTSALVRLYGEPSDLRPYGHLLIKKRRPRKKGVRNQ